MLSPYLVDICGIFQGIISFGFCLLCLRSVHFCFILQSLNAIQQVSQISIQLCLCLVQFDFSLKGDIDYETVEFALHKAGHVEYVDYEGLQKLREGTISS